MIEKNKIKLEIFFPGNGIIQLYNRSGLTIVKKRADDFRKKFSDVRYLSFGKVKEFHIGKRLGLEILNNKGGLNKYIYFLFFPFIHASKLREVSVLESRQVVSGILGLYIKLLFGKPLAVRCGYDRVEFSDREGGMLNRITARLISYLVYRFSDLLYVTSGRQIENIKKLNVPNERILYLPNSVDIDLFKPDKNNSRKTKLLIAVGRLERQKNYFELLDAVKGLADDVQLLIFGRGSLEEKIKHKIKSESLPVKLMGTVDSETLISYLQKCTLFVLPSRWEGNSNAVIEAMACGAPVLVSRIEANKEIVRHNQNGYLTGLTSREIQRDLVKLLNEKKLRERLSTGARETVLDKHDLRKNTERLMTKMIGLVQ